MMTGFTRILQALIITLLILQSFMGVSQGIDYDDYTVVYRWDKNDCEYDILDMTQYEKRLIVWDGKDSGEWCQLGFQGDNPSNVATSYKTCFRMLDYKILNCDTSFLYDVGYGKDISRDKTFSCGEEIPNVYCVDDIMKFKVYSQSKTSSYARLEIYVEAGINLSIAACLGIVGGIFVAIILMGIVISWKCRKGKSTDGRVIGTIPNSSEPNATGQVLMGYPITMQAMQPCGREQCNPLNYMVQQNIQMPPTAPQPTQNEPTPTEPLSQVTVSPQGVTYTPSG